jgi:hypothetical protein
MNFLIPLGLLAVGTVVAVAGFRAAKRADDEYQLVLDETDEAIQVELVRLERPSEKTALLRAAERDALESLEKLEQSIVTRYEKAEFRDVKTLPLFVVGAR